MIGVNVWNKDSAKLKEFMTAEEINWRTFVHDDAISRQWNRPATPAFYFIDHEGVIQRKWTGNPGEIAIDSALSELIQKAQN